MIVNDGVLLIAFIQQCDICNDGDEYKRVRCSHQWSNHSLTFLFSPSHPQVNSGHQWYMQVVYTIGPTDGPARYKRSAMGAISKRAAGNKTPNGTNMHPLLLSKEDLVVQPNQGIDSNITTIASVLVAIVLVIFIIILFVGRRRRERRRRREEVKTEPVPNNRDRAASRASLASVKAAYPKLDDEEMEMEMDIQKSVKVSTLNLYKPDNLYRSQAKVKKVNLEAKYQGQNSGEGGTEV